jgi:hypothetical protein
MMEMKIWPGVKSAEKVEGVSENESSAEPPFWSVGPRAPTAL